MESATASLVKLCTMDNGHGAPCNLKAAHAVGDHEVCGKHVDAALKTTARQTGRNRVIVYVIE